MGRTWSNLGLRSATASILSGESGAVKCTSTNPVEFILSLSNRPSLDDLLKLRQAIGQSSRTGLQDQGRFNLVQILVLHSRDFLKARPRRNALRPEFLPHHDPMIRSGSRATTSSAVTTRSL